MTTKKSSVTEQPGTNEFVEVEIFVEPVAGGYEVVTHKDGKPWLRNGPFEDLDFANMICREMLKRGEAIRARYLAGRNDRERVLPLTYDDRPQRGGWAPGRYINLCRCCDKQFWGAKMARYCADCAYGEQE